MAADKSHVLNIAFVVIAFCCQANRLSTVCTKTVAGVYVHYSRLQLYERSRPDLKKKVYQNHNTNITIV